MRSCRAHCSLFPTGIPRSGGATGLSLLRCFLLSGLVIRPICQVLGVQLVGALQVWKRSSQSASLQESLSKISLSDRIVQELRIRRHASFPLLLSFLNASHVKIRRAQRMRAEEVSMLIREAFLRGISTRQVGRVVAVLTGEVVSAQTVSKLTRDLDEAVRQFHQARLSDDYAYPFLDGVSLRVRGAAGRKRVQMLVAYGVRRDGTRHLLAFLRSQGEGQTDWEGLLGDLYRRWLEGKQLGLIVTDGCPGLAAAIPTVYPRARHQRCWVHKMRNILEKARKRDYDEMKAGAQAIYLADSRVRAEAAFRAFRSRWRREYGSVVRQLQRDLPELLSYFAFPRHLWRKLRTTNVIERCFVEVRRRTRPMVCFVNVESVDRIIYSIFQRFNLEWKTRTLSLFTQAA